MKLYVFVALAFTLVAAQKKQYQNTTPVPILKQIDRHNDDGSYSYGYEAADGTYKIETKYPDGEVYGKYGYIDDVGTLREVEYGASRRGFEPAGSEIKVAPPTLKQTSEAARPLGPDEEDDGQYREDPADYYKNEPYYKARPQHQQSRYVQPRYEQPKYEEPRYEEPIYEQPRYEEPRYKQPTYKQPEFSFDQEPYKPSRPSYRPETSYKSFAPAPQYNNYAPPTTPAPPPEPTWNNYAPQKSYNPAPVYNPAPSYNPAPASWPGYDGFRAGPAQNVDIWSGSYTVNYR